MAIYNLPEIGSKWLLNGSSSMPYEILNYSDCYGIVYIKYLSNERLENWKIDHHRDGGSWYLKDIRLTPLTEALC